LEQSDLGNSMNVARVTVIAISQGLITFVWSILVESAMVPAAIRTSVSGISLNAKRLR